ncbi:hydrolase, partial [Streptomyces sp. SID2131]|nr:hydrolase [Streptomyces sp. SID2131]
MTDEATDGATRRETVPGDGATRRETVPTDGATRRETVPTDAGDARVTWYEPDAGTEPRTVLALGHGAGGGIEARDLRALAGALPARGVTVALVEQPWRVAG